MWSYADNFSLGGVPMYSFFDKVVKRREAMQNMPEKLQERVDKSLYGSKSKAILKDHLEYESSGQVGFALFDVPPVIAKGIGSKLYDADGKEYIDLLTGHAVSTVGQCHPRVVKAINEHSGQLIHFFDYPTPPRVELAKKLTEIIPGSFPKKVWFSVTGSDATENAIKAARWYTGSQFILSAYGAYHGTTAAMMATTTKGGMWSYFYPIPPHDTAIARFPYAYCYRCPYGREYPACDLFCVKWIEQNLLTGKESPLVEQRGGISNVAALIVEPMQSSAGYIIPPDDYLRALKSLCDNYGILFIADEIQAGLGRTGKMWAVQNSGVEPDIMCVGKGIAGGLPMSMVVAKAEVLSSWAPGAHVSTFAGYTLGCAVALEVLKIMEEEKLVHRSAEMGKYFLDGLRDLQEKHPILGHVDGRGLYIGIEFVKDRKTKEPAIEETDFMFNRCLEKGLLFEKGGYFYNRFQLIPALTIDKAEIDYALRVFDETFGEAEKKFGVR